MIILIDPLEASDTVDISIDKNGERIEVPSFKKRNPYTLQFLVPGNFLFVLHSVNTKVLTFIALLKQDKDNTFYFLSSSF